MAWEARGGGLYYYRCVWRDGRPVKEYVGTGRDAVLIARLEAVERDRREMAAADARAERARFEAAERPLADLCTLTDGLAVLALMSAGYHLHKRQWRRRRGKADAREDEAGA